MYARVCERSDVRDVERRGQKPSGQHLTVPYALLPSSEQILMCSRQSVFVKEPAMDMDVGVNAITSTWHLDNRAD